MSPSDLGGYGVDGATLLVGLDCLTFMRAVPPPPDAEAPGVRRIAEGPAIRARQAGPDRLPSLTSWAAYGSGPLATPTPMPDSETGRALRPERLRGVLHEYMRHAD